ncbi:MAG: PAS domain-containing protein, partial [Alphaproteobacteria bacterium]|nr:PAS domain-containing protein [Alphaproteobacteria bacterium]
YRTLIAVLAGGGLAPWPAVAATGGDLTPPVLAAALVAILSALMLLRQWRRRVAAEKAARRGEAEAAGLAMIVAAAPAALLAIDGATGAARASSRLKTLLDLDSNARISRGDLMGAFDPTNAGELAHALEALAFDGRPFALALTGPIPGNPKSQRHWRVEGSRAGQTLILAVTDISELVTARNAAADVKAAADRLGAVLRAVPIPLWTRRPDHRLDAVNQAALDITGDRPEDRALAERAAQLGSAQSESRAVVIGGQHRLAELTEVPIGAGATVGYATDATQLEQTQAELARHVAAHAEVLESLATAIAIFGADAHLKFFNAPYARLWHLDPKWLAAGPSLGEILELLRERRQLPEVADFQAFKRERLRELNGTIEPQDDLLHLPDGATLRRTIVAHPFGGALITFEDVTDRLALESSYNTLIEVQRETLDNLREGVAVFGGDGRLKLSNPAFRQLWRIDRTALAGERHVGEVLELMRPLLPAGEDWADMKARMIADVFERTPRSVRLARPDGTVLDVANVPLPDDATQIVYIDATDQVGVENALRERNVALEATDRLKSEFIANVSYELRTPLNAIIGFSEILTNAYFGTLNPRQLEYARGILESSSRLVALINNILDLAAIEAGYLRLERADTDMAALAESVVALSGERARSAGIQLDTAIDADIGIANVDDRRIKQALFNLISNAVKYTPKGGRVTVAARRDGDVIELAVADTGTGIPSQDQTRVFEKFARGEPGSATGLGLGLALVKSYVELHGGEVGLTSAPGAGTTVTCRLPIQPPADAPAQAAARE